MISKAEVDRIVTGFCWALAAAALIWTVVRVFGLERGYPFTPVIAFTPYAAIAAVAEAAVR
jgi:hypothetical protein